MLIPDWQIIILQSKANGAPYDGDKLPLNGIKFPRGWFSQRLELVRRQAWEERESDET